MPQQNQRDAVRGTLVDQKMLRLVVRDFGTPVIAWACNISDVEAQQLLRDDTSLGGVRATILNRLVETLFSIRVQAAIEGFPINFLLSHLSQTQGSVKRNILNAWREEAGGELPGVAAGDPVALPLQHLALDAYPTLLMMPSLVRREGVGSIMAHSTFSFAHPAREQFEAALLADEALRLLFPTRGENALSTYGYVMASTGRGGSLQLVGAASQLLQASYALMRMRDQLSVDALFSSVQQVVEILREAASGKEVRVPAFAGFNNVSLETSSPIEAPWGTLRPYADAFSEFVPSEAGPSHFNDNGTDVTLGFILETSFPFQLLIEPWAPGPSKDELPAWPTGKEPSRAEFEHKCRLTSLALSLGIQRDPPVAAALAWTMMLDPLFGGSGVNWNVRAYPPLDFFRVKEDGDSQAIADWASAIALAEDSNIRIAQRRIVSALTQPRDPVDAFIDAVVAWENLYGRGQGELTFRISTAMALLLSEDLRQRSSLQTEIAKLYGRRSQVLHGDIHPSPEDASQDRNRALFLVLATLRRLYSDFPALIANRNRGKVIILSM
jgi:hypothetical protein